MQDVRFHQSQLVKDERRCLHLCFLLPGVPFRNDRGWKLGDQGPPYIIHGEAHAFPYHQSEPAPTMDHTWHEEKDWKEAPYARKSGNAYHMSAFRDYKKQTAKEVQKDKVCYINERVLGELEDGNTKPFYRYIKSLRMDNIVLPPLKSANRLVTSALGKATILLNEFSCVFTREDTTLIPWLGPAQYKIGEVVAPEPGVWKLLLRLKPHKASSPDQLPNQVLKELA